MNDAIKWVEKRIEELRRRRKSILSICLDDSVDELSDDMLDRVITIGSKIRAYNEVLNYMEDHLEAP